MDYFIDFFLADCYKDKLYLHSLTWSDHSWVRVTKFD
jgi:hypothetical protein